MEAVIVPSCPRPRLANEVFAGSCPYMFNSVLAVRRLAFRPGAPLLNVEDVLMCCLGDVTMSPRTVSAAMKENLQVVDVNHEKKYVYTFLDVLHVFD